MMPRILVALAAAVSIFAAGCAQVHEPWVAGNRLVKERARSPEARQTLRHRFSYVQTDR